MLEIQPAFRLISYWTRLYLDKRRLLGYDIEGMAGKHSLLLSHTKESTISLPESFRDKLS